MSKNARKKPCRKNNCIREVVVVEGKTDTSHLKRLFDVQTIETNGSALNKKTINLIKKAALTKGVILFLDPDYAGEKIRRQIIESLQGLNYKEAFINQKQWHTLKKGVSEANDQIIIDAIKKASSIVPHNKLTILWDEYDLLPLHTYQQRLQLCESLGISYANHKQLFQRLNMLGMNYQQVKELLKYE